MAADRAAQQALIAQLQEEDAFIEFPPEAETWSLDGIQTFYDTCGEIRPDAPTPAAIPPAATAAAAPVQQDHQQAETEPEPEPEASLEEMRADLKQRLLAAAALAEKHRALAEAVEQQQTRLAALDPPTPTDLAHELMPSATALNLGGLVQQPPAKTGSFPVGGWKSRNPQDLCAAAYRAVAITAGIPFRPHGLFGPADARSLQEMAARPGAAAFQKHLWDTDAQRWALAKDTWVRKCLFFSSFFSCKGNSFL
jgi:hypothetical protein